MEPSKAISQWLDAATRGIRFGPDRRAVRAELEAHLEDKALDLQRIFLDLSLEEAQARAAAEMGGAEEIGRDLAQIHRPWLGYAWLFSKVLLGFVIGAVLLLFTGGVYQSGLTNLTAGPHSWYSQDWPTPVENMYSACRDLTYQGPLADSGPISAGEYIFSTHSGALWTVTVGDLPLQVVYVQLEVRHSRPLEALSSLTTQEFWAEDDRGGVILSQGEQGRRADYGGTFFRYVRLTRLDRGVFTDQYEVMLAVQSPEAERVELRYTCMGADVRIPLSLEVVSP